MKILNFLQFVVAKQGGGLTTPLPPSCGLTAGFPRPPDGLEYGVGGVGEGGEVKPLPPSPHIPQHLSGCPPLAPPPWSTPIS